MKAACFISCLKLDFRIEEAGIGHLSDGAAHTQLNLARDCRLRHSYNRRVSHNTQNKHSCIRQGLSCSSSCQESLADTRGI